MPPLLTALFAITLAAEPASARPMLVVDPGRDAALSCGANAALGDALRLALPDVPVLQKPSADPQALFASLSFEDRAWRFWLTRVDGTVALARRIDGGAEDCVVVANASAVIVERYLSDVAWSGQSMEVAPLPPPPPLLRSVSIQAGPTLRPPLGAPVGIGLELAAVARVGRLGIVQLGGWYGPSDTLPVTIDGRDRGALHATQLSAWLGGGACYGEVEAASVCGGGFASAYVIDGRAEGDLFQKRAVRPVSPALGIFAMGVQPLGSSFEVAFSIRSGVLLSPPVLTIEGTDAALRAPGVDLEAGVRFGWKNIF